MTTVRALGAKRWLELAVRDQAPQARAQVALRVVVQGAGQPDRLPPAVVVVALRAAADPVSRASALQAWPKTTRASQVRVRPAQQQVRAAQQQDQAAQGPAQAVQQQDQAALGAVAAVVAVAVVAVAVVVAAASDALTIASC